MALFDPKQLKINSGSLPVTSSWALHVNYSSSLPSSSNVPYTVGGISSGTALSSLNEKELSIIVDRLLFPTINPTFTNPSLSTSPSPSGLVEIGSDVTLVLTSNFNRGSILQPWSGNSFQNFRSGIATEYRFANNTIGNVTQPTNVYTFNNYIVYAGYNVFNTYVTYSIGPQPLDNFGGNYGSPLPAGVVSSQTYFEGVYPIFATSNNTSQATKQSLVSMATGNNINITLAAEVNSDRQRIWIPTLWINSRPLISIQYFNTVSNQFDTSNKINDFIVSNTTLNVQGNNISYKLYTYNGITRGSTLIRLIF